MPPVKTTSKERMTKLRERNRLRGLTMVEVWVPKRKDAIKKIREYAALLQTTLKGRYDGN